MAKMEMFLPILDSEASGRKSAGTSGVSTSSSVAACSVTVAQNRCRFGSNLKKKRKIKKQKAKNYKRP
jgi:hypothetical protein